MFVKVIRVLCPLALVSVIFLLGGCAKSRNRSVNANSNIARASQANVNGQVAPPESETDPETPSETPYIPHGKAATPSMLRTYGQVVPPYSSSDPPEIWLEFPAPSKVPGEDRRLAGRTGLSCRRMPSTFSGSIGTISER